MRESWIEDVEYRIRALSRELGTRWIVAVSGGGDSVGLLRILHRLAPSTGLILSAAHLNHGTRAEASQADADFVAELAGALGIPCDVGRWRPNRAGHFEVDARRARYAWLTETARARGASAVAVGHTSDDQAETILHRIIRGTGPRGLAGIPERRTLAADPQVTLVRPLLAVGRREIHGLLADLGQTFREDSTNTDLARTRSRIRHDLIPKIQAEYNPRIAEALNRLGQLASASNEVVAARIDEFEVSVIREATPNRVVIDRTTFNTLGPFLAIELLRRAWNRAGWPEREMSTARWERLHEFAVRPVRRSRFTVGAGVVAVLAGDDLVLTL